MAQEESVSGTIASAPASFTNLGEGLTSAVGCNAVLEQNLHDNGLEHLMGGHTAGTLVAAIAEERVLAAMVEQGRMLADRYAARAANLDALLNAAGIERRDFDVILDAVGVERRNLDAVVLETIRGGLDKAGTSTNKADIPTDIPIVSTGDQCGVCSAHRVEDSGIGGVCGRCKRVWYCSRTCQRTDWPDHKTKCYQVGN